MIKKSLFVFLFVPFSLFAEYETDFQQRAEFIVDLVYDYGWKAADNEYRPSGFGGCQGSGNLSDYGKYVYPWMIAHFEKDGPTALDGPETQKVNETFDNEMHTCPTFHFNLVGLPRLMYQYSFEPNFHKNSNGGHLKDYLSMVFNRTDSYNAFTVEGTENHLSMSRNPAYLYAQLAIDSGYTEDFPKAADMLDSMKVWIMTTSKTIYTTGVAEWNASTYGAYNIIGWLLLYDFAKDEEVKLASKAVLDYYAAELALHYQQGMTSGPEMRGGSSVKSLDTETDILSWLWFGDSPKDIIKENFNSSKALQTVHAATSNYRPPYIAVQLARKELTIPAMYYNSKSGYLYENPSQIKQTFYISNNYSMGAAYTPYGGWSGGDWQIVSWKMVARVEPGQTKDAQYASGGLEWGNYRKTQLFKKPYEQFVHHKNVMVAMTKRPVNHNTIYNEIQSIFNTWRNQWSADFYQRFPGDTDRQNPVNFQQGQAEENQSVLSISGHGSISTLPKDDVRFVEMERVYLAIRYLQLETPAALNDHGAYRLTKDTAPDGNLTGIVLEVCEKSDFASFIDFMNKILDNTSLIKDLANDRLTYTSYSGDVLDITYEKEGTFSEPIYDWGYGPTTPMVIHRSPPFLQPDWPSGSGHGTRPTFYLNDSLTDFNTPWPVYSGPNFRLDQGILELNDTLGNIYRVDYTENLPLFETISFDVGTSPLLPSGEKSHFRLYPNPSKGNVQIDAPFNFNQELKYRVTDINGRLILQGKLNDNQLNISVIPAGVYHLHILDGVWKSGSMMIY
jgi:hypothetical protein